MPELTVIHIGLMALMLAIGVGVGWYVRADRCAKEKIAVSASWQDQLESQQSEHSRLAEQNKSLMEQISQYQASQKDYSNRAKELSESLKEAFSRRDALQRQLKDMRGKAEVAVAQRNQAREELQRNPEGQDAIKEKDDKIFQLSRELTSWQSRVPPLVERFQKKNKEALLLEEELGRVQTRLQGLEDMVRSDQTRIEPVDAESLPDGGDASNEPIAMTSALDTSEIQDQIDTDQVGEDLEGEPLDEIEPADDPSDGEAEIDEDFDDASDAAFSSYEDAENAPNIYGQAEETVAETTNGAEPDDIDVDSDYQPDDDAVDTTNDNEVDDLKQIKGIGPSIERTLNELGIHRFHQVAELSEYEIDRVAQRLRGFRSRVYREDWIGQARDLHYQKNGART